MSKNTTMVEVIALHDLSYIDHNKEPQYRRQSSRPFLLDKSNADQFLARKAIKLFKAAEVEAPPASEQTEVDDFADEEDVTARAGENVAKEAAANPVRGVFGKKGR